MKIFNMPFRDIYVLYIKKVEKKGGTKEDVDAAIYWLTGYSDLEGVLDYTVEEFFKHASLNENRVLVKGVICGYRIEDMEEGLMKEIRYLDKIIDELSKGKSLGKIVGGKK